LHGSRTADRIALRDVMQRRLGLVDQLCNFARISTADFDLLVADAFASTEAIEQTSATAVSSEEVATMVPTA
jgi:hypothetical protein